MKNKDLNTSITAIVNTRNAEKYLAEVLEFLKGFDEILVCDMESTDRTVEIAGKAGCRIVTFPADAGRCVEVARDFALRQATGTWVLFVDADEIIPAALQTYLKMFVTNPRDVCALEVARKNFVFKSWNKITYPDYQLRFMRRSSAYWPPKVHARPVIDGKIDRIPASRHELAMLHFPPSQSEVLERLNRYTDEEVKRHPGMKVPFFKLVFKPMWRFIHSYFLKGGFLYGRRGLINACNNAVYKFYTLVKIYESGLDTDGELERSIEKARKD